CDQAAAGEVPLNQVVTEDGVFRKAGTHGGLKGIKVVDPFPGIAAGAEEILIDVGDRHGVRVDPGGRGVDAGKQGPCRRRQVEVDPGLQDAVPFDHAPLPQIELRLVERVRERPYQPPGSFTGQVGVLVEGDYITDGRELADVATAHGE